MRKLITEKDFSEFYVLNALSPLLKHNANINLLQYRDRLINDIVDFYLKHIQSACVTEAMHSSSRRWPTRKEQVQNRVQLDSIGINKQFIIDEEFLYADKNKLESAKRLIIVFRYMIWEPAYGGEAWAGIAELYQELAEQQLELQRIGRQLTTRVIRDHISGKIDQKINHIMNTIDRIHQVEHNTGSIFTKFPGNMCKWLEKSLNEKATSCSIQLLRDNCDLQIAEAIKLLGIKDASDETVEREVGEVILSRAEYKARKNHEVTYVNNISQLDEDLYNNYITQEQYNQKKEIYLAELNEKKSESSPSFFNSLLSNYTGRNQRGILRAIINRNEQKLFNDDGMLMYYVKEGLISEEKMFDIAVSEPRLHKQMGRIIAPYIFNINGPHKKNVYDLLYSIYPSLKPSSKLKADSINNVYDVLASNGYDMSKCEKFAKNADKNNDKIECNCIECKPHHMTADAFKYTVKYNVYMSKFAEPTPMPVLENDVKPNTAKTFAIKYAGKLIQKIAGKSADKDLIAGKVIGYIPATDSDGAIGVIVWVPTAEYNKKYPEYKSVDMPENAILTYEHYDKSQGVHYTQFGYIELATQELILQNEQIIDWFEENKKSDIVAEEMKKESKVVFDKIIEQSITKWEHMDEIIPEPDDERIKSPWVVRWLKHSVTISKPYNAEGLK